MLVRQGDIYITRVKDIPAEAEARPHCVLAEGEVTGHSHRIDAPGVAKLFASAGVLFLDILADSATVVHEEHGSITLGRGRYRVWRQREYSPEAIRTVLD
jgi:hypothetical protein